MEQFKNSMPVSRMVESLSRPITLITPTGKHYSFRKFLWMGNWGFTDVKGMDVIVPAKPGYRQVGILVRSQLLVAGCHSTGWDVFSLEGEKIRTYPPMSLDKLRDLVDKLNPSD